MAYFGNPGYTKLPSGLIIQFGLINRAKWTDFAKPFPHACISVVATMSGTGTGENDGIVAKCTQTQVFAAYGYPTSYLHNFIAIGY